VPRKKYYWTPEQDDRLRSIYQTSRGRARMMPKLERFACELRWPRHVLLQRAQRLGISKDVKRPWSDAEIRYVDQHAGKMSTKAMADVLGRTYISVAAKVNLGWYRCERHITLSDIALLFSVTWDRVVQWSEAGWIEPSEGDWYTARDLHRFMLARPGAFDPRTVDAEFMRGFIRAMRAAMKKAEAV
jgi:hypothetical protein